MVKDEKKLLELRNEQLHDCLEEKKHLLEKYEKAKKEIERLEKELHAVMKRCK